MTAPRSQIGLGDLIRALDGLRIEDDAQRAQVMACLGFRGGDPNPAEGVQGISDANYRLRAKRPQPSAAPPLRPSVPRPRLPDPELPEQPLQTTLEELPPLSVDPHPPAWLDQAPPPEPPQPPIARIPLFPHRRVRGLLTASAATRRQDAVPDMGRLLRNLTRGRPLTTLPLRARPSLHRGAQLLLDVSAGMTPWYDDLGDLARALEQLFGRDACPVYEFEGDPNRASRWNDAGHALPWQPQQARPLLIASDLGRAQPPGARHRYGNAPWRCLFRQARSAACPVVIFNPLPPERWPRGLSRLFTLIHWAPHTRASAIRRQIGPGHELRPSR